jgi:hypothetical protein
LVQNRAAISISNSHDKNINGLLLKATSWGDFLLASQANFGQNQVPRVTADFVIVQFHISLSKESIVIQRRKKSSQ